MHENQNHARGVWLIRSIESAHKPGSRFCDRKEAVEQASLHSDAHISAHRIIFRLTKGADRGLK